MAAAKETCVDVAIVVELSEMDGILTKKEQKMALQVCLVDDMFSLLTVVGQC